MLRILSKIFEVLAWGVAVIGTVLQLLVLFAFSYYFEVDGYPLMFAVTLCATLSLWAGMVTYRKRATFGMATVTISAALFITAGLLVRAYLLPGGLQHINPLTGEVAMDSFKLLINHYLPVLTAAFLWLRVWTAHLYAERKEAREIMEAIRHTDSKQAETLDIGQDTSEK